MEIPYRDIPGNGGGLHITGGGSATIIDGTVNNNTASSEGGGLWNGTGTMLITGTTISGNTASGIAADQGGGGIYNLNGGTLTIETAVISNNIANGTLGSGGGILNDVGSHLSVTDTEISSNTAVRAGGGIEDNSGSGTIVLANVSLNGNSVSGQFRVMVADCISPVAEVQQLQAEPLTTIPLHQKAADYGTVPEQ
ncbi:hypothetical protein [Flavobacterium sp. 3HN19-14]|uniref:hypothetical protein n=1 Tax=Flavobacterium sp. 3HN19-14 TaxID=3448133 RepID=UPI003EDF1974